MKKMSFVKRGVLIGLVFGILHHPLLFLFQDSNSFITKLFDFEYNTYCNIFGLEWGEPCGSHYLIFGFFIFLVIYALIGGIIGEIIEKRKNEK